MNLSRNTILVTGGGSGIGLEFTKNLAKRSNKILICGRDIDKLKAVQKKIPSVDYFQCDLTSDQEQQELVEHIRTNYREINMLINNAGIQHNYNFDTLDNHINLIDEEINTNFTSQIKLIDRLLPLLFKQHESAIVNITSLLAVVPKQSAPVYCASKAAFRMFTKALRYQLEGSSVNVFEVVPPLVNTQMTEGRGAGKISAKELVSAALHGVEKNESEILVGKTRELFFLKRFMPNLANNIIRHG